MIWNHCMRRVSTNYLTLYSVQESAYLKKSHLLYMVHRNDDGSWCNYFLPWLSIDSVGICTYILIGNIFYTIAMFSIQDVALWRIYRTRVCEVIFFLWTFSHYLTFNVVLQFGSQLCFCLRVKESTYLMDFLERSIILSVYPP